MERYVERCYRSLAIQKDADDIEFIFVNDGSSDKTLSILKETKACDSRVVIVDQKNAGVSSARNSALTIAKGEYVYLLDGDDYLTKNSLLEMKLVLNKYKPDLLISAYNLSINNKEIFKSLPFNDGLYEKKDFFRKIVYFPTTPQLVYRTDIIKKNNIRFDSSIKCGEVYDFTINYIQYINRIFVLNRPTFNYFQRDNSATHRPNLQNDITVVNALNSIYSNGKEFVNYGSFIVTAFKLMRCFSYTRYLKYSINSEIVKGVDYILSDSIVKKCIKDTLFKPHGLIKERLLALHIYLMPKRLGFYILNCLVKK